MRFETLDDWLAWQETLNPAGIDLGLDRVRQVMRQAGLADTFDCPLVMVAGTNGKGSVVALAEAIAREAGYRVCAYTSPHLLHYNERIRCDGEALSDAALCAAFERIDAARGEVPLTYFEFGTLAAIDVFHEAQADLVIMEIGLGGRLDAVNAMQPDVSVITTIALDHTDWLGGTLDEIAAEKAGVMRSGKPVILGKREPPRVLYRLAQQQGARTLTLGRDYAISGDAASWSLACGPLRLTSLPMPALAGARQLDNAACAIVALLQLDSLELEQAQIARGLQRVRLPGRLQQLASEPEVIVDVAHNPQAVKTVVDWCKRHPVAGDTHVVLAMLADKPVAEVIELLGAIADSWHIAGLEEAARGLPAAVLGQHIGAGAPGGKLMVYETVDLACAGAARDAGRQDRVLVTGSFYTVAAGLRIFGELDALTG